MRRRGFAFNKGALIGVPVMLLVLLGILYQDRLPQVPTWLLITGWLALTAVVVSLALLLDRGRTKALQKVAGELGLSFSAKGTDASLSSLLDPGKFEVENTALRGVLDTLGSYPPEVRERVAAKMAKVTAQRGLGRTELRHLSLFREVDHPSASNVMAGPLAGGSAVVFDYSYQTRDINPKDTFSVSQTVAAFRFPGLALPAFEVSRKSIVARVASAVGLGNLEFESHPGFSGRFRLRADDETAVRRLFEPSVLELFEGLDGFEETVEGAGECVVVYRGGREVAPAAVPAFVRQAAVVASVFGGSGLQRR